MRPRANLEEATEHARRTASAKEAELQRTSAADIDCYISGLVPARLPEFERMEEIAWTEHFPIIGPAAGNFCYLVARMIAGDRDWVASIIPIRDGLLVARRH